MELVGYRNAKFVGKDGNEVRGFNLYLTYPILNDGKGIACVNQFITEGKMASMNYTPKVGDNIEFTYNRFGSVAGINPSK